MVASRVRPLRELKGFKKVYIKPGEKATVDFELGYADLGYYIENGEYTVEAGNFKVYIGGSSLAQNSAQIRIGD